MTFRCVTNMFDWRGKGEDKPGNLQKADNSVTTMIQPDMWPDAFAR
jgi:hypothetical protein